MQGEIEQLGLSVTQLFVFSYYMNSGILDKKNLRFLKNSWCLSIYKC